MVTESIFQNIADEIFADEKLRHDDRAASMRFFNLLISAERVGKINYEQSNFFVAQETDSMDRITKLATLLPTKLTITNICRYVYQIDHGVEYDSKIRNYVEWEDYGFLPSGEFCNWLHAALPLLNAGIISYYPNTVSYLQYPDGSEKADKACTVEAIETCAFCGQIKNKDYQLSRIAELQIPYIYDISLSDYGKISLENMDALQNFRSFFAKSVAGVDFQKEREVAEFQYELAHSVRDIETVYKRESLKLAGSLVMGTLATVGASLLLFKDFGALYDTILGLTGGGGVLQACNNIFAYQIERVKLKNEDCYFLWLLNK